MAFVIEDDSEQLQSNRFVIEEEQPSEIDYLAPIRPFAAAATGALKTAANIGTTIAKPFLPSGTREDISAAFEPGGMFGAAKQAYPVSFGTGEIAGAIAGTGGIGGMLGKGAEAIGLPRLAAALESGGVTLGETGKKVIGNTLARLTGGSTTGAVSAGLIDPKDIELGALAGGAVGVAAPALKYIGGKIVDIASGNVFSIKAKKLILDSIGDALGAKDAAIKALKMSPDDISASQAMYGATRQEVAALEEFAAQYNPNVLGKQGTLAKAQEAAQLSEIAKISGGTTARESAALLKEGKETLNLTLDPKRVEALNNAGIGNVEIPRLQKELQDKTQSLLSAMKDAGELHTLARQQINLGDKAIASNRGWAGDVKASRHYSVAESAQSGAEDSAKLFALRKAEGNAIQAQIGSLEEKGLKPIDHKSLIKSIEDQANQPGVSKESSKALNKVANLIRFSVGRNKGSLDPYDIHSIRKEDINNIISKAIKKTDPSGVGELSSRLGKVRTILDSAIEDAGGKGWTKYLEEYAVGSNELRKWKMGAIAQDMIRTGNKQALVDLVSGNTEKSLKTVEKIFGKGRNSFINEMGDLAQPISNVAKQVERDIALEKQALAAGKSFYETVLPKSKSSIMIPNMLSAKITAANAALSEMNVKINAKTVKAVSIAMESPQKALAVLNTLSAQEKMDAYKLIGLTVGTTQLAKQGQQQ